jgi:GMP reductase
MRIENDVKLDFKDVLIRPKRSTLKSRSEVSLTREYITKHSGQKLVGVPVIAANMDTVGTFEMATALAAQNCFCAVHKHYSIDDWRAFVTRSTAAALSFVAVSSGASDSDFEKLALTLALSSDLRMICLDVANGYTELFVSFLKRVRAAFPKHTIIAGNVVTGEMCEELILSGADIVKVGIGPGSVCTTRKLTGVGYPQLSAVVECADAAHGLGGLVVSDGGCTCPGDVAKAFGAGADFVMMGGMLAGHAEGGGEDVVIDGQHFRQFYGMSSDVAMEKYSGGVADYRASEGKSTHVPFRGPVKDTILQILGGIRSSCTYVGAKSLKEISKRTTFIRVTAQLNEIFSSNPAPHQVPKSPHMAPRTPGPSDNMGLESPQKRAKTE